MMSRWKGISQTGLDSADLEGLVVLLKNKDYQEFLFMVCALEVADLKPGRGLRVIAGVMKQAGLGLRDVSEVRKGMLLGYKVFRDRVSEHRLSQMKKALKWMYDLELAAREALEA